MHVLVQVEDPNNVGASWNSAVQPDLPPGFGSVVEDLLNITNAHKWHLSPDRCTGDKKDWREGGGGGGAHTVTAANAVKSQNSYKMKQTFHRDDSTAVWLLYQRKKFVLSKSGLTALLCNAPRLDVQYQIQQTC